MRYPGYCSIKSRGHTGRAAYHRSFRACRRQGAPGRSEPVGVFIDGGIVPGRGQGGAIMLIPLLAVKLPVPAGRSLCGIIYRCGLLAGPQVAGDPAFGGFTGDIRNRSIGYGLENRRYDSGGMADCEGITTGPGYRHGDHIRGGRTSGTTKYFGGEDACDLVTMQRGIGVVPTGHGLSFCKIMI